MVGESDFLELYLDYVRETEPPYIYHRWCAIASIGALLGRSTYIQFGHQRIFPNLYCLLVGEPGTRKTTAIKHICRKLLSASGYETFAADKTSKEKFLLDLEGAPEESYDVSRGKTRAPDAQTLENLWGSEALLLTDPKEVYILADEFSEFSGTGNAEFYTTLGNFWDWDDAGKPFTSRLKNTKSVSIFQPTVSILGGTTPSKFAKIFPTEIMDDGFLSRMILIKGERSDRKYDEPPEPDGSKTDVLVAILRSLRTSPPVLGPIVRSDGARSLLREIYFGWEEVDDVRFKSYSTRRYTQLLKLCIILTACTGSGVITEDTVVRANTYLSAAEAGMPSALGEFGKSRNSDVVNKIMDVLHQAREPLGIQALWKHVNKDLDKIQQLGDILEGLRIAGKTQRIPGKGILPLKERNREPKWVDWSLLTTEERGRL